MALLVDGDVSRLEDLRAQDSSVLEVANGEGIDLRSKMKIAEQELGMEIRLFLQYEGRGSLERVAVEQPLGRWHVLKTLEAVYRDAYFSQLNDRYGQRWHHYEALAEAQRRVVFGLGLGLVQTPLHRPVDVVATVTDGLAAANSYWLSATYVNASGEESAASAVQVVSSPLPHTLTVEALYAPAGVTGWNVYLGTSEERQGRQTVLPMAAGAAWIMPETGPVAGPVAGSGQAVVERVVHTQTRRG